jgi:hypothetical protein
MKALQFLVDTQSVVSFYNNADKAAVTKNCQPALKTTRQLLDQSEPAAGDRPNSESATRAISSLSRQ